MAKSFRKARVFIDWSQNMDTKTTATVYSLRANTFPSVSTPLSWREVQRAARSDAESERLGALGPEDVLKMVSRRGDLFAPVLQIRQTLPFLSKEAEVRIGGL
jgi:bifunctional non-homologous end joining protein LigD